jgi:hypothetical protein
MKMARSYLAILLFVCLPGTVLAQPAGLKATAVKDRIRLRVQPAEGSSPAKPQSEIVYIVDNEPSEGDTFAKDQQFAAMGRSVVVTVANFNPLTSTLTVTMEDAADPSHEITGKLVESLLSVSTVLGAKIPEGLSARIASLDKDCKPEVATDDIRELNSLLNDEIWSGKSIKKAIDDAARAIGGGFSKGGAAAVGDGVRELEKFLGTDQDTADLKTLRLRLKQAQAIVKKIEAAASKTNPDRCEAPVQIYYLLAVASNPNERLGTLTKVVKGFSDLVEYLRAYADGGRWSTTHPAEFVAKRGINPTPSTMKKVKVTYATRAYEESTTPGVMTVKNTDAASAEFTVRRYSAWVPEIGVGLTFNKVDRPVYGTGKNAAGETVIALSASDTSTKIDPTLLVNFVCGFCGLTPLTPMFQVGTSTSKTSPAILLGGGVRFAATAKGDFAIGFGAILPWAKQLKNENDLGKVIPGTAALDEHLEWQRVKGFHSYLTLQYKF